jgi:hypothetical protein
MGQTVSFNIETIAASGLLFIGDPHQRSKTPGRRMDEKFYETVSRKISQSLRIAEENDLVPVFLGDFFDQDDDTDAAMLVSTIKALQTSGHKPWTLVGNHEKRRTVLTDDTSLAILISSGMMKKVPDNGVAFIITGVGHNGDPYRVAIGGTGYDHEVPKSVLPFVNGLESTEVVWLTHHDWWFEGSYPNAMRAFPIEGCGMVVNGHIHLSKKPIRCGKTTFFNPGNITRMSIDSHKHVPRVWMYKPGNVNLMPFNIEFQEDVFDWSGKVAHIADVKTDKTNDESSFVALLSEEIENSEKSTEDGTKFLERMDLFCKENEVPVEIKNHLAALFKKVRYGETS